MFVAKRSSVHFTHLEWHPRFPVLAVSATHNDVDGEVNVFYEDGQKFGDASLTKRGAIVASLAWHPRKKVIAIGWNNGLVTTYSLEEQAEISVLTITPGLSIAHLHWSSEGSRVLVADTTGYVAVHKVDTRGSIQSVAFAKNRLKEPTVSVVLKPPFKHERSNVSSLQAGNKGDDASQSAGLEQMISKKTSHVTIEQNESATFFLAGKQGSISCLRDSGVAHEILSLEHVVMQLLYYSERNILVTLTEDLTLFQHLITIDAAQELLSVKLSGKGNQRSVIWAGPGVLAVAGGETVVRLWDLTNEENQVLKLEEPKGYHPADPINCISYCFYGMTGVLAAGTHRGNVAMWKRDRSQQEWKLQPRIPFSKPILRLQWCENKRLLAVGCADDVLVLSEQTMCSAFGDQVAAVQTSQSAIVVTNLSSLTAAEYKLSAGSPIEISLSQQFMSVLSTSKRLTTFELHDANQSITAGAFDVAAQTMHALYGQNIYLLVRAKIDVRTLQGTSKQILPMSEDEGDPTCKYVNGHFLVVGLSKGYIRVYDLSRREARQHYHPKYVGSQCDDFGTLTSVSINSAGNKIAFTCRKNDSSTDSKLYIWDAESESVYSFNFLDGSSDFEMGAVGTDERATQRAATNILLRYPDTHAWDPQNARFLVCQATILPPKISEHADAFVVKDNRPMAEHVVASFFVTAEHGILLHSTFSMPSTAERVIGVAIPFIYFSKRVEASAEDRESAEGGANDMALVENISRCVQRQTIKDFMGIEKADKTTCEAMMNFAFHLATENMDEAFKAIKQIKSEHVWENMAQMCVKSQRLDVAMVCLGNMGHARGAKALRETMRRHSLPELQLATLAIHLGMTEDAERLYRSCGRYDLLNRLYQCMSQWKKAVEVAEKQDRVHARNTYFAFARHLEAIGAFQGAVDLYEKSGTHRFEVPRMLLDSPALLEQYVKKTKEPTLRKWWAQYLEGLGEIEQAMNYYTAAQDYFSVVRLQCYMGNLDEAAQFANDSNDKAACYHLARQYEHAGDFKQAIHFFSKAHAYGSAIRLCKEHGLEMQVGQLALLSNEADMIEAARYYESKRGQADKAVMLYHKAGMFGRALDLAFRTEQYSSLDLIANDLDASADPRILERCAEFFLKSQQYNKAVQLLAYAHKFNEAIDICVKRNIPLTEQLAESLTPTKEFVPDPLVRNKLLQQLADCCMQQGHYHLAAKKYTQAGSKIEAMRALLKSGDTEKIIFFANTARTKEIFIMAANYLQTLDWKRDQELTKHILAFYNKAQASDHLARFYDACAQVEIDEYRDYEKALEALSEALRCLSKVREKDGIDAAEKQAEVNRKIELTRKFLQIRDMYEGNAGEAVKQLQNMLDEPNVNNAVRLGDIFAVLIMHNVKKSNFKKAHQYMEDFRKKMPKGDITRYVKQNVVDLIQKELNLSSPVKNGHKINDLNDDGAVIPESAALRRAQKDDDMIIGETWLKKA